MVEDRIYTIPAQIGAALSSGRGIFAEVLAKEVKKGDTHLCKEEVSEIICLVGDLIEDNRKLKNRILSLNCELADTVNEVNLVSHNVRDAVNKLNGVSIALNDMKEKE
jgi:hypothetical protein